jgi:hypothetical protein
LNDALELGLNENTYIKTGGATGAKTKKFFIKNIILIVEWVLQLRNKTNSFCHNYYPKH